MGKEVQAEAGSVLNARSGTEGLQLQVNEGKVVLLEEDGMSREIEAGMVLAMDEEGSERREASAVVLFPRSNARYIKTTSEPIPVNFVWNRINLEPEENLKLEIAADREFATIVHSLDELNAEKTSAEASLDSGTWRWRLSHDGAVLTSGQITIVDASGTKLLNPVTDSLIRYDEELPSLRFQWTETEGALSYALQISETADFRSPRISTEISAPFYVEGGLTENTWYWRVMPLFSSQYEGDSVYSASSSFRIEQSETSVPENLAMVIPAAAIALAVPIQAVVPDPEPIIEESPPPPPPRSRPAPPPPPPPPLASASMLLPTNGSSLDFQAVRQGRKIDFAWSSVRSEERRVGKECPSWWI
jgi:hypothetical protein